MKNQLLPELGKKTYVMGIINLTPDSFSGDGLLRERDYINTALLQAEHFIQDGCDILDLGAESTRPGAAAIGAEEELSRLLPVVQSLREELPDAILSIDTYKAETARVCLGEGAQIINDIWGFRFDPAMGSTVAEAGATAILMHNRTQGAQAVSSELGGRYEGVQYDDIVTEVRDWLAEAVDLAVEAGVGPDKIIIDPGIGFGKTIEQNLFLLKHIDMLRDLGFPILLGISRKGFIGHTLNLPQGERLEGSLAANAWGVLHGVDILRVHDVRETVRLARMLDAIRFSELPQDQ
ncbi:MAG TPA: dihydropteroate synthase [Anaerolineaceae bacterium]|nr:dihydropteroate synthase [Anaerolineaceae bacterium]